MDVSCSSTDAKPAGVACPSFPWLYLFYVYCMFGEVLHILHIKPADDSAEAKFMKFDSH